MKKLVIICMLMLFSAPVFAAGSYGSSAKPAVKGNFIVSLPLLKLGIGMGDLYEDGRVFAFGAYGYENVVQYVFMDSLAIGGKFGYENEKAGDVTEKMFTLGPVADYFIDYKLGPTLPYAGAGLYYTSSSNGEDVTMIEFDLHGGVVYMLNKYFYAYGQLQINYDKYSNGDSLTGQKIMLIGGIKAFF